MKTIRIALALVALAAVLAACGGDDDAATTTTGGDGAATTTTVADRDDPGAATSTTVQSQPEGGNAFFSIEEVGIDPDGWVALRNFTDVPVTLSGLHLCQAADCFALPDEVVPADGFAYVATGAAPEVEGVVVAGASIGTLAPSDGELALFVSDPMEPENLVGYLEWGSTPHDHTQAAIDKGLWLEGSYAPSGENAVRLYRNDSGLWLWEASG